MCRIRERDEALWQLLPLFIASSCLLRLSSLVNSRHRGSRTSSTTVCRNPGRKALPSGQSGCWRLSDGNFHGVLFAGLSSYSSVLNCRKGKGKAIPLQAWADPEGSRRFRLPDFMTTAHEGGKVVSPTYQPPLRPGNIPGTHFC